MSVELGCGEVAARAQHRQRPHDPSFSCARYSRTASRLAPAHLTTHTFHSHTATWKNVSSSVEATRSAVAVEFFFFVSINLWLFVSLRRAPGASSSETVDCHRVTPSARSRYYVGWPRIRASAYCTRMYKI